MRRYKIRFGWIKGDESYKIRVFVSLISIQSQSMCLFVCLSSCLYVCLAVCFLSGYLFLDYPSVCLSVLKLVCRSACYFIGRTACLSIGLNVCPLFVCLTFVC